MAGKSKKESTFEEDVQRLEVIVTKLEEGGISLDESLVLFEEGQEVLIRCRKKLNNAKVKIEKLLEDDGKESVDLVELGR